MVKLYSMKKNDKIKITSNNKSATKGIMFALGGVGVATAVIVPTMYFTLADNQTVGGGGDLSGQLNELEVAHQQLQDQITRVDELNKELSLLENQVENYEQLLADSESEESAAQARILELTKLQQAGTTLSADQSAELSELQTRLNMLDAMQEQYTRILADTTNQRDAANQQLSTERQKEAELQSQVDQLTSKINTLTNEIIQDGQIIAGKEAEIRRLSQMVVDPAYIQTLYEHSQHDFQNKEVIHTWYEHIQLMEMGVQDFSMFTFADTYVIPEGTKTIPDYAFSGAQLSGNTNFRIPNSVTKIGDYAFAFSQLPLVSGVNGFKIPHSVTYIGRAAFDFASVPADFKSEIGALSYLGPHSLSGAYLDGHPPVLNNFEIMLSAGQTNISAAKLSIPLGNNFVLPTTMYLRKIAGSSNFVADMLSCEIAFDANGVWTNKQDHIQTLGHVGIVDMAIKNNSTLEIVFGADNLGTPTTPSENLTNFMSRVGNDLMVTNLSASYLDDQGLGGATKSNTYRQQKIDDQLRTFDSNVDGQEIDASASVLKVWTDNNNQPLPHVHNAQDVYSGTQ